VVPADIIKRVLASLEARRRWRDAALISIMAEVGARQSEVRGITGARGGACLGRPGTGSYAGTFSHARYAC
jgi:integrase